MVKRTALLPRRTEKHKILWRFQDSVGFGKDQWLRAIGKTIHESERLVWLEADFRSGMGFDDLQNASGIELAESLHAIPRISCIARSVSIKNHE
jgi:hypothetical protein